MGLLLLMTMYVDLSYVVGVNPPWYVVYINRRKLYAFHLVVSKLISHITPDDTMIAYRGGYGFI